MRRLPPRVERVFAYLLIILLGFLGFVRTERNADEVNQARIEADRAIENERIRADLLVCNERNKQLAQFNAKFAQLNALFDRSIQQARLEGREPSAEILRLYEEYKQPTKPLDCSLVANGRVVE